MARARKPTLDLPPVASPVSMRDRVIELKRVPSDELLDNNRNWRLHPYAQQAAVNELLDQVGIAGALTAYYSERNGGALTLIDGHERKSRQAEWPTLILDVTDEEADLLLLTLDPIVGLAQTDPSQLDSLLENIQAGTPALVDLLQTLDAETQALLAELEAQQAGGDNPDDERIIPEMELQPFEHYDYVMVLATNTYDAMKLWDMLGIETAAFTLADGRRAKIGMGRVIDAKRLFELVDAPQAVNETPVEDDGAAAPA